MIYLYCILGVWGSYYIIPDYYGSRYRDFDAEDSSAVSFYWSYLHTIGSDGHLYMANPVTHTVSILPKQNFDYPGGLIRIIVGIKQKSGYLDGDASTAVLHSPKSTSFYSPSYEVTYLNSTYTMTYRYLYIADTGNNCIRKVDLDLGEISEYVGRCTVAGFKDGPPGVNRLNKPSLVGSDQYGNLYIYDSGNAFTRFYNASEGFLHTLINGACRATEELETLEYAPKPYYNISISEFDVLNLSIKPMICITSWIKTSGQPIGHLYQEIEETETCLLHDILCGNRTHPLVTGNA